jgi:transketolase
MSSSGAFTPSTTGFEAALVGDTMANAIRALSMDAVQQANSGHPGMPMGMADIAVALWSRHLKHNPSNPKWLDRDRFVLSNGHGSMLLYSLLHLTGYDLPLQELKNFRQLHSKTPGHPEVDVTPGVETTTGPLGQGVTNAVGMALAEKLLAAEFNRPSFPVVDHFTYAFVGDGCLMEGISHEACSLAGTLKLSKLIVLWDDNGISIDGQTKHWFDENVVQRFQAYGWNVVAGIDGHDTWAVDAAIARAKSFAVTGHVGATGGPTLIQCKTAIGKGSPSRAGTSKAHGEPLGAEEIAKTRAAMGWKHAPFEVPQVLYEAWDGRKAGAQAQALWDEQFRAYFERFPNEAQALERRMAGDLPADWNATVAAMFADTIAKAETNGTRKASQAALNHLGPKVSEMIGGSADLTGSNNTDFKGVVALRAQGEDGRFQPGRHINFGVREFGMSAMANGMALHGGFIPYVGTFLTFSDYARNALRMAALMKQRVVFVYTHDSIGLGEDGPTHQSVEHAASLRLIPNMDVWRPADSLETAVAWQIALERKSGPSSLLLSRQNCAYQSHEVAQVTQIARGAYVLHDVKKPKAAIIATGSEVQLAIQAAQQLAQAGIAVRVVSMPSTTVFDRQDVTYKLSVLPDNLPRIAVEAGVTDGWWKYRCAAVLGLDWFGESAPAAEVFKHVGLTVENIVDTVKSVI